MNKINELRKDFAIIHLWSILMNTFNKTIDFGYMQKRELIEIGETAGNVPVRLVLFCVDMMRIGMAEVYGHVGCGESALRQSYVRNECREDKDALPSIVRFFCENMVYIRRRMRFKAKTVDYFFKKALESPKVFSVMKHEGIEGLKHIMHFSGLSMYKLLLVVQSEHVFFALEDIQLVNSAQLDYAMTRMKRAEHVDPGDDRNSSSSMMFMQSVLLGTKEEGVDLWGERGPDMMSYALALVTKLAECSSTSSCSRRRAAAVVVMSDSDFLGGAIF